MVETEIVMKEFDHPPARPAPERNGPFWPPLLKRLAIWALFFAVLYLARDFFFVAFMTFLLSYLTLTLVDKSMHRLSPDRERPLLRRLVTLTFFVLGPAILLGIGCVVMPQLIAQGQHFAGWVSQVNPELEVSRFVERFVGPSEFQTAYGGPDDPRYRAGLDEFRQSGARHVGLYYDFPKLENWIEAGFSRQFAEAERGRIRARLLKEGTSSKDFETWFFEKKVAELQDQAGQKAPAGGRAAASASPLVRAAATAKPGQLLQYARSDAAWLAPLQQEWIQDEVERGLATAQQSSAYHKQLQAWFDEKQVKLPGMAPLTFDQYIALQSARRQGPQAFGEAVDRVCPAAQREDAAQLRSDFEAAKKHELFKEWWGNSATAKVIRSQAESNVSGSRIERIEQTASSLLNVPLDLGTSLLLSLFICIDFPTLRRATRRLRETWLRDAYDEMAPALTRLGQLIGRAMVAQGLIALCNAILMFIALVLFGVDHAALLGGAVFVLCLVPTLGMIIAWGLILVVALIQPDGGLDLALKVSGAVVGVALLETFVFSPRILGRMMEIHPVLIIAILPLAQYFFGIWGLILATPVAVYVIHELILQEGLLDEATSKRSTA